MLTHNRYCRKCKEFYDNRDYKTCPICNKEKVLKKVMND